MKVLTATREKQGFREGDYSFAVDGELVYVQEPCARDRGDPANECGCSRAFAGLSSARPTTTARIAEFPDLTLDRYVTAIGDGLDSQGWGRQDADSLAALMVDIARQWPAGTVIERSFWEFSVREMERSGR